MLDLYDNPKLAVASILGDGKRLKTKSFSELQSHYLFADRFGRPGKGNDNAYVERVIGSIRRECLDYLVIVNARHLRRVLSSYLDYYHRTRTHLSLDKDCPDSRPIMPRSPGKVVAIPQVAGLHHRYERLLLTIRSGPL